MQHEKLFEGEYRFMQLIWDNAPVNSGKLVELCSETFGWKKSTTYTMIKKMCEKGYISNENAVVKVLIEKDVAEKEAVREFVDRTFGGSIFDLFAAFYGGDKISESEAEELKKLIEQHKGGVK
jgi:predicted transcriptional regulator